MSRNDSIAVGRARREDLSHIVRLLAEDTRGRARERPDDPLPAPYHRAFDSIARDERNRLVVAEANAGVIGCLQVTFIPGLSYQGAERALIEDVRVEDTNRRTAPLLVWDQELLHCEIRAPNPIAPIHSFIAS